MSDDLPDVPPYGEVACSSSRVLVNDYGAAPYGTGAMVAQALEEWDQVDIVVNNAGYVTGRGKVTGRAAAKETARRAGVCNA
ncbi:hypothetical protein [Streptomyces sp. NPDC055681]